MSWICARGASPSRQAHRGGSRRFENRYKLTDGDLRDEGLMDKICIKRGCLNKGEPDRERCAAAIIDDFRKGRMGRVSLEAPQAEDEA